MSKKRFNELLTRALQPVPREQDTQLHPDVNSGKQTRPRKAVDAAKKPSGMSRGLNASTGPKSPR